VTQQQFSKEFMEIIAKKFFGNIPTTGEKNHIDMDNKPFIIGL
jgi:hypothetical protein